MKTFDEVLDDVMLIAENEEEARIAKETFEQPGKYKWLYDQINASSTIYQYWGILLRDKSPSDAVARSFVDGVITGILMARREDDVQP
jgi:hypothetical protein